MGRYRAALAYVTILAGVGSVAPAQTPSTQPSPAAPTTAPTYYPDAPPGVYSRPNPDARNANPPPRGYWQPDADARRPISPRTPVDFARNHFDLTLGGMGMTAGGKHGNDSIGFATLGIDYFLATGLSIGIEGGVAPGTTDDRHHNRDDFFDDHHNHDDGVRAEEALVMLRWHFLTCGPVSLYADGGVGGLWGDFAYPNGGKSDNALGVVGGGLSVRLANHLYLAGGGRYARIGFEDNDHHDERRHGANGGEYYLGITIIP